MSCYKANLNSIVSYSGFPGDSVVKNLPAMQETWVPSLCWEDPLKDPPTPEGEHGNPLQYSCLENPTDRGARQAAVPRVAQSWAQLRRLSSSSGHPFTSIVFKLFAHSSCKESNLPL